MTASPLRAALDAVIAEQGCSLKDLTVLAPKNNPFRVDTPARHWLQAEAAKAARFLGYIPFDQITDQRNAEPVVRIREYDAVHAYLTTELDITIPNASKLRRSSTSTDSRHPAVPARARRRESCLADVLGPLADRYNADLFLPTGEISDTQIYLMARAAENDGRPLAVFYFADCDPAGWQMRHLSQPQAAGAEDPAAGDAGLSRSTGWLPCQPRCGSTACRPSRPSKPPLTPSSSR